MTHRSWKSLVAGTAIVFALTACDSDSTGPGDDSLSQQEVEFMMEALMDVGGLAFVPMGFGYMAESGERGGDLADQESGDWNQTQECPLGGSVHTEGTWTWDEDEASSTMTWDITQTHQSCTGADSNDTPWTFDGNPNLNLSGSFTESETEGGYSASMQMSQGGGIAWERGGMSGSCNINVDWSMDIQDDGESESISLQVHGSVCGQSISIDETMTYQ